MNTYIIRCFLYALPLPMVVNVLTFMLFFFVNSSDDMAGMQLGQKNVTEQSIKKLETPTRLRFTITLEWRSGRQQKII
ncbi:hypothetical protein [Methylotuvimicrobium sp.]|jgi:peptide/nickel transport system permease protein|uniref:hypothetical protein n=1 Tax=Methylotuvimicrobium sp. TaxID=2822413 RepID=UPI003D650C6C